MSYIVSLRIIRGISATTQNLNMSDIYTIQLEDFDSQVLVESQRRIVLVDFWAQWCPPCLVVAPILSKVVQEYVGRLALAKLEVDEGENMKLAGRYQVRGFPTIILFRHGEERDRFSGAKSQSFIEEFISPWLE